MPTQNYFFSKNLFYGGLWRSFIRETRGRNATVKQMPREITKKRVKTDTTSNEDGGNATVPATETTTATETTDVVSLTPMVMSGMEMIRLSLSVIYDITFISSYEVSELVQMLSPKQARILRSQRNRILNGVTKSDHPDAWQIVQAIIAKSKQSSDDLSTSGVTKILNKISSMERRLLGGAV